MIRNIITRKTKPWKLATILNTRIGPGGVSTLSQTSDVIIIAGDAHNAYKDRVSLLVNSGSAMKIRPAWLAMLRTTESHPFVRAIGNTKIPSIGNYQSHSKIHFNEVCPKDLVGDK